MRRWSRGLGQLGISLAVLLGAQAARAQVDVSGWPQVQVEVLAVDGAGAPVQGLSAADLQVQAGRGHEPVAELAPVVDPQSVCVLVDASNVDRLSLVKAKAKKMLRLLAPEDHVCLASFGSTLKLDQPLTGDRRAVEAALEGVQGMGGTQMLTALVGLSSYMRGAAPDRSRAILLFSDGADESPRLGRGQLQQALGVAGSPVVHFIVLPQAFGHAKRKQGDPAQGIAFAVTDITGGLTYFPHTMEDVNALCEALPEALRTRYRLTYTAANAARDGHEEHVRIVEQKIGEHGPRDGDKTTIRAPEGFYAPSQ